MEAQTKKKNLGKGLSALFGDEVSDYKELDKVQPIRMIAITQIEKGLYQPRKIFSDEELLELTNSIRSKGVLQPILVRRSKKQNHQYELIAGERRWRAATNAGLKEIPVIIKDLSDAEVLEVALIENLIRQDLNSIDEAEGYKRLLEEFNYTQEQLSDTIHKSRSHIANTMRLLQLPEDIKDKLRKGELTAGHARAILRVENKEEFAKQIIQGNLSVREAEKEAQKEQFQKSNLPQDPKPSHKNPDVQALEESLQHLLGLNVRIHSKGSYGYIQISYQNLMELDEIATRLSKVGMIV